MIHTRARGLAAGALLAAVTLLAACGTTEPAASQTTVSEAPESSSGPLTFTDGRGEEVTLPDGPATRVVVLEWSQAEAVVSLGVEPVGLADVAGYTSWVGTAAPLTNEPTDVGVRREPSIETIATLEPDLILGSVGSIPDSAMEQMERIAPIALMTGANGDDPLGLMRSEFTTIATALGQEDNAEKILATYDDTIAANAQKLADAGLEGTPSSCHHPTQMAQTSPSACMGRAPQFKLSPTTWASPQRGKTQVTNSGACPTLTWKV